jgi:hypothetical protein
LKKYPAGSILSIQVFGVHWLLMPFVLLYLLKEDKELTPEKWLKYQISTYSKIIQELASRVFKKSLRVALYDLIENLKKKLNLKKDYIMIITDEAHLLERLKVDPNIYDNCKSLLQVVTLSIGIKTEFPFRMVFSGTHFGFPGSIALAPAAAKIN